jgi:hypothetical protein
MVAIMDKNKLINPIKNTSLKRSFDGKTEI